MKYKLLANMCQYGVWPNCNNACSFCLRQERQFYTLQQQYDKLKAIEKNIDVIDWENKFSAGISLLGGEIYNITDKKLQDQFLVLIDKIIDKILKVSKNPARRYSTVTNGIYDPTFLLKVLDRIADTVGVQYIDINFSYDLKYRFRSDTDRKQVLSNINLVHKRYNYRVGVQMILTQYVINKWKKHEFDVNNFIQQNIPGSMICFLYPHKINTGLQLGDFFFSRNDFINFLIYLKKANLFIYRSFVQSVKHSAIFKYTGLAEKKLYDADYALQQPILTYDKRELNKCGHSMLYKCYSDTDKCLLCDLEMLDYDDFL